MAPIDLGECGGWLSVGWPTLEICMVQIANFGRLVTQKNIASQPFAGITPCDLDPNLPKTHVKYEVNAHFLVHCMYILVHFYVEFSKFPT